MAKKFKIPSPLKELAKLDNSKKYSFGETANRLHEIKQYRPVFAFDFISLNGSDFCFNSNLLNGQKDFHRLFQGLKNISNKSYDELSTNYAYHFHEVDFSDISIPQSTFIKCLVPDMSKVDCDHCPTVYQFKLFEEARVFGFISKMVFYLVLIDRNHKAYARK